ncbi:MAG TPA: arginine deiminase-related protein [Steroidobacteraceae bacterium]|nr:arginine deiminase-related protein [Steroidobacteraceae bacterium]
MTEQCASVVLMVRPAAFDYNPQTAATNSLQKRTPESPASSNERACAEFEQLVRALESEGVQVCVVDDTAEPPKPDAIFPNNWVSFHADGTVVLYPMHAENRRRERRSDVLDQVAERTGFQITRILDLTEHEQHGRYLEGTGSLVLDHVNRVAYASISPRTHPDVVNEWSRELGYEPVTFTSLDRAGKPIYHTNVMLCIGERAVVVGTEAIVPAERARVLERLRGSGREVVEIGLSEVERFAGNMLELASWDEALGDCRVLVMSASARRALPPEAFARLSACTDAVLAAPIPTIETLGGGSVRCMLAEVFLPS